MYTIGDYIEFRLPDSDEHIHQTKDYEGKILVLYTYPRDNTPGCSIEAKGFSDLHETFKNNNAIVIGINNNSLKSHQTFINKYCLPFPLLIDADLSLIRQLGATKEENKVARKTYIINEKGVLEKIYDKVSPNTHPMEVLDYLKTRK